MSTRPWKTGRPAALTLNLTLTLALALPLFLLPIGRPAQATEKKPPADLSGIWSFDEDLTKRLQEDIRQREAGANRGLGGGMQGRGRRGGGGGGGAGGGGGRQRGGSGGGDQGGAKGEERGGEALSMADLDELTIAQHGADLTVTDKAGKARVLHADGRKVRDPAAPGGPAQVRSSWTDEGSLEVEVTPDKGPSRIEIYQVANDRKKLFLTITVDGPGRTRKFVRAYEAGAPEAPPAVGTEPPGMGTEPGRRS